MAKPSIRISGGNPAGMPDFRPLNPHGAAMPKLTRAMPHERDGKAPEVDLYQIWVTVARTGRLLRIGPKMPRQFLEPLLGAINAMISTGRDHDWRDPHLLPAEPELAL